MSDDLLQGTPDLSYAAYQRATGAPDLSYEAYQRAASIEPANVRAARIKATLGRIKDQQGDAEGATLTGLRSLAGGVEGFGKNFLRGTGQMVGNLGDTVGSETLSSAGGLADRLAAKLGRHQAGVLPTPEDEGNNPIAAFTGGVAGEVAPQFAFGHAIGGATAPLVRGVTRLAQGAEAGTLLSRLAPQVGPAFAEGTSGLSEGAKAFARSVVPNVAGNVAAFAPLAKDDPFNAMGVAMGALGSLGDANAASQTADLPRKYEIKLAQKAEADAKAAETIRKGKAAQFRVEQGAVEKPTRRGPETAEEVSARVQRARDDADRLRRQEAERELAAGWDYASPEQLGKAPTTQGPVAPVAETPFPEGATFGGRTEPLRSVDPTGDRPDQSFTRRRTTPIDPEALSKPGAMGAPIETDKTRETTGLLDSIWDYSKVDPKDPAGPAATDALPDGASTPSTRSTRRVAQTPEEVAARLQQAREAAARLIHPDVEQQLHDEAIAAVKEAAAKLPDEPKAPDTPPEVGSRSSDITPSEVEQLVTRYHRSDTRGPSFGVSDLLSVVSHSMKERGMSVRDAFEEALEDDAARDNVYSETTAKVAKQLLRITDGEGKPTAPTVDVTGDAASAGRDLNTPPRIPAGAPRVPVARGVEPAPGLHTGEDGTVSFGTDKELPATPRNERQAPADRSVTETPEETLDYSQRNHRTISGDEPPLRTVSGRLMRNLKQHGDQTLLEEYARAFNEHRKNADWLWEMNEENWPGREQGMDHDEGWNQEDWHDASGRSIQELRAERDRIANGQNRAQEELTQLENELRRRKIDPTEALQAEGGDAPYPKEWDTPKGDGEGSGGPVRGSLPVGEPKDVPSDELFNTSKLDVTTPEGADELASAMAEAKASGVDKMHVSRAEQRQAARIEFKDLLNTGLEGIDPARLERLSGAEQGVFMDRLNTNIKQVEATLKQLSDPSVTPELAGKLQNIVDGLRAENQQLLQVITRERSQPGRDLNFQKLLSRVSNDPAVWLTQAEQSLRKVGRTMTDDVESAVMKLVNDAKEACK